MGRYSVVRFAWGAVRAFATSVGASPSSLWDVQLRPREVEALGPRNVPRSAAVDAADDDADVLTTPVQRILASVAETARCLASTVVRQDVEAVVAFLRDAGVPPKKILSVVQRYPELLTTPVAALEQRVQKLREMALEQTAVLEVLTYYPEILGMDFEAQIEPVRDAFAQICGNSAAAAELISLVPVVLAYDVGREIQPKVEFLQSLGCTLSEVQYIIGSYPSVLCLSIPRSIQPKIDYLRSILPRLDIKRAILSFPGFLDMSLETHIKEKIEFFLSVLKVNRQKFTQYLPHYPQIFSCEIEGDIKRKIEVLCVKLSITKGRRKRLQILKRQSLDFMACPSIFGLKQNQLIERIEEIHNLIFGNVDLLDALFVRTPLLFGCTVSMSDVERVGQAILQGVGTDRLQFLQIVREHPEILYTSPDDMKSVLASIKQNQRLSVQDVRQCLEDRGQFMQRLVQARTDSEFRALKEKSLSEQEA